MDWGKWWTKQKLKTANENRNKIAHYQLSLEVIEGVDGKFSFPKVSLEPHPDDRISQLKGQTPDRPEHSLDPPAIVRIAHEFVGISNELRDFTDSIELPKQQPEALAQILPWRPRVVPPQADD